VRGAVRGGRWGSSGWAPGPGLLPLPFSPMQIRVIPAASRTRPKSRTNGDVFPESPGGNGAGPVVVRSVIFPRGLHRLTQVSALYALVGGMVLEVDLVFQCGEPLSRLMIITGSPP